MVKGLRWRVALPSEKMGSGTLAGYLRQAIDILSRSTTVPDDSRPMRALRLLEDVNAAPEQLHPDNLPLLDRLAATHRTAWETFLIMYAATLVRRFDTPFTPDKLRSLVAGDDLHEGRDTEPRDIQFELFVAAWLILGGCEVTPGEPDLRLLYGRERVGVAAKRVSSLKPTQLKRRVKSAVQQVKHSGSRGFLALNLDSRFAEIDPRIPRPQLLSAFDQRFDELNALAPYYARDTQIIGLMSFGYASTWVLPAAAAHGELPGLHKSDPFRWYAFGDDTAERELFQAFSEGWAGRIGNRLARLACGEFD